MNILVISDIHIGNYPNYETYKYERLEFYITYAKRIVEIAQENNCKLLFIAGDFMDAPVNSPEVLRVAKQVIEIWSSYFDEIYYILGQHDLRSKNYDDPKVDKYSITNVLASPKMKYSDHSILDIGGRHIAMMNFSTEHDLSWITEVDLFITHWTINTNGFGEENRSSDKFTLGIAGDIHYPCNDGNLHSIGISIPRYLGDAQSGTSVIVNLDTLEWKRVENDPDHKLFTRYIKTSNWEDEGPSEEKLSNGISPKFYRIYRPSDETLITQKTLKEFSDDRVKDINEIIQKSVTENHLEKIHEKVLSQNPISQSIDLNFKLLTLTINNVRSIDEYVWDLTDKKGVYQIVGENGCFIGSTRIKTPDGKNPTLEELYNSNKSNFPVYSLGKDGIELVYAEKCELTKYVTELCEVELDDGTKYECTLNHKFLLVDGSEKEAKDLTPGTALYPIYEDTSYLFGKDEYSVVYGADNVLRFIHQLAGNLIHPNYLDEGLVVHHKDVNPFNNDLSNLEVITPSEHTKIHRDINQNTGVKLGYYSETVSNLNEAGSIIFGKISKFFRILLKESLVTDWKINEEIYEKYRSELIDLGYIHFKTPHWSSIEGWGFSIDDLWNDASYDREGSYSWIENYKDPEYIKKNLEERDAELNQLRDFNSLYHPRLRNDVTFDKVEQVAKELHTYSPSVLADHFKCSRSKINSIIYSEFYSIEEFANYLGLPYINHKVSSVRIKKVDKTPVYDLINTGSCHNFAILADNNSGVFVHNSGKSSLMWSLNYALRGGLDIRDQIREGETQASVYLKLEYQGKVYGIYRGTDGVWLDIDGEYQSFGGKRDTENAIYEQLPFINYLDSFFFDDEAVSIMGSYSSDRRIELLSTYYRIDVLQTYYDTCTWLLQELNAQSKQSWNEYYTEEASYNSRKQSLESKRDELSHLLRDVLERDLKELNKQYKKRISLESQNKGMTESEYNELKKFNKDKLLGFEGKLKKNQEKLEEIKKTLKDQGVHHTMDELSKISHKHSKAYEELMEIKAEIKSLKSRLENFSEITCPTCGTIIGLIDSQKVSKKDLEDKLEKLRNEFHEGKEAYENEEDLINSMKNEEESYKSYQSALKDESTIQELINSLQNQFETCSKDLEDIETRYKESLDLLKGKSSKEIEEEMNSIRASIFQLNELDKQEKDLLEYEASGTLEKLKEKAEEIDKDIEDHQLYQQLFSNNGNLYKLILNSILERFNSDSFRYEAVSEWYRGKEYTDITGFYKNYKMKDFRPYWKLSRGQKTLVDLDFIRNLITNAGVVVFDEILKFLSPANQIEGIRIINEMNPPLKIITNQSENSLYVDKCLNLRYNGTTTEFSEG